MLFVAILGLIRFQHQRLEARRSGEPSADVSVEQLQALYPNAALLAGEPRADGGREVLDAEGEPLGYVLQTSPASDHIVGFSGPTNTLIAFDLDDRIIGIDILSSEDTRDHVAQVIEDETFMQSFDGLTWQGASAPPQADAVTGATLTSLAIQESIIFRLSGGRPSLRFPDPLTTEDARALFPDATTLEQDEIYSSLWHVRDADVEIGTILRTSPQADNILGYQGPTETRIGFDPGGRVVGISLGRTYDNEQYVTYVREDEYFLSLFNELTLDQLAELDMFEDQIEGVSGATMTSMTVAEGLIKAAEAQRIAQAEPPPTPKPAFDWKLRDLGTAGIILAGLVVAFTSLRGSTYVRIGFQLLLIGYLGLINGDMVSQAMIAGWAKSGVPWSKAGGLILLTAAAFAVPVVTRRNVYCSHLCPHGAVQQLVKNRLRWQLHLRPRVTRLLKLLPALLLLWCVIVAMGSLAFSLVDIEPFDAWVFRVAGWATITVAIVGLIASLFVPMAYCRFGCPTGALLNFFRFNSRSDRWTTRDWFALSLVAIAAGFVFF